MSSIIPSSRQSRVRLNDFARLWADVGEEVTAAVQRVGRSGWYILGPEVQAFEQALAQWSRLPFAVGCANGLDAIEIALRALDLQPGQEVLTTPLSAFATSLAIMRAGGRPVFVDTDDHGLLDLDAVESRLQAEPDLRALVVVHLYGRCLDLERLQALRDRYRLLLIEDMAQAVGASWQGTPVGSVGQLSATSFYPTKNLGALGDAGAILGSDPALQARCRTLRDYGQAGKYHHVEVGLNSRLDELQAALLGQALLPRLEAWTNQRRRLAQRYLEGIRHPLIQLPAWEGGSVWHLFVVRTALRDQLATHLADQNIESAVHYPTLIPDQPALSCGRPHPPLPRAQALSQTSLSLPIHPYLEEAEVDRVIATLNAWNPS